jgi:hypothetical protein
LSPNEISVSLVQSTKPGVPLRGHAEARYYYLGSRVAAVQDRIEHAVVDQGTQGTIMDLPVRFPSDIEVITEEVARFRALSDEDRMRSIHGLLAAGSLMMKVSPKADFLRQYTLEQENRARQAIREFLARHAG